MNQIQKAVVQTFCTKLEQYIAKGIELQDAMSKLIPVYNKADVPTQLDIRSKVAKLVGIKQGGVKPIEITKGIYKGSLGFSKVGKAQNSAREMLRTMFPTSSTTSSTTAISKQVDKIDQSRKRAEKFAEAHKKSEIQQRIAELNAELKALKAYV
jgi:hypothetical protein